MARAYREKTLKYFTTEDTEEHRGARRRRQAVGQPPGYSRLWAMEKPGRFCPAGVRSTFTRSSAESAALVGRRMAMVAKASLYRRVTRNVSSLSSLRQTWPT